ncbi:MAG: general secretion pathway protein GspB [Steroidobacteraceae bacterium]
MSFILDALKKSEAERNRQSGPALINMRILPPRRRLPLWVIAPTVILLANLAVLAVVLLRGAARTPSDAPVAPTAAAVPQAPVPIAPAAPSAAAPPGVAPQPESPAPVNVLPPPALVPEPVAPRPQAMAAAPRPPPAAAVPEPAAAREDYALLPSATDLRLTGVALPEMRLALHVYDASAASRYVLLNSQRLREGDSTADGLLLERVTPTGVVLSWRGQRFRLEAGE